MFIIIIMKKEDSQNADRKQLAAQDPKILIRKIETSMRVYRLGYSAIVEARELHMKKLLGQGNEGAVRIGEIFQEKQRLKIEKSLINTERKYIGILQMLARPNLTNAFIGRKFGLTRERTRVFLKQLVSLSAAYNIPIDELARNLSNAPALAD